MPDRLQNNKHTVSEIANALGLSVSTVSNVLKNKASASEKVRQQVMDYASKIGYDPFSDEKEERKHFKIVAAVPSLPSSFWDDAVAGINDALKKYDMTGIDFRIIRFSKLRDEDETARMLDIIEKMNPDACLAVPCCSEKIREKLKKLSENMLTAIIDEPVKNSGAMISVTGNYEQDGIKAAEIIHDFPLDEKKILLICSKIITAERVDSFTTACKNFSDTKIAGSVEIGDYTKDLASKLSRNIATLGNSFNCIYNPNGTLGPVCLAIQKLGLAKSVYVVGHDSSPAVKKYFSSGLKGAIIRQDIYTQSNIAMKALMDRLLSDEKNYPESFETGQSSEIYL